MTTLNSAQIEQDHNSKIQAALLPHRFSPLSDGLNDTIDHMAITAAANLTLLKSQFDDKTGVRADNETIYYSIMSIRSDIKDIMAVIGAIDEAMANIGKCLLQDPSDSSSFDAIFSMAARANGVLGLLCHQFSDDDHARPNDDDIYYTIDSLIQCTTDIRRAVKKQQA